MTETVTLLDEVHLLVERGIYKDHKALLEDALRSLLRSRPELRGQLAMGLYKEGKVSLSRAAEIGGLDLESFKELLGEVGIPRTMPVLGSEIVREEVEQVMRLREGQ